MKLPTPLEAQAGAPSIHRNTSCWTPWRVATSALGVGLFVFISSYLSLTNPLLPSIVSDGFMQYIDQSWMLALQYAWTTHLRFGHDIVFTYGPLGWIGAPIYYPQTYHLELLLVSLLSMLIAILWLLQERHTRKSLAIWLLLSVAVASAIFKDADLRLDMVPLLLFGGYLRGQNDRDVRWIPLLILSALSGICLLVKTTLWMSVGIVLVYITLHFMLVKKRFPWPLIVVMGAATFAWFASGQRATDAMDYVRYSIEIISGYKEMTKVHWAALPFVPFVISAAVLLLWLCWKTFQKSFGRRQAISAELVVAGLIFLYFKHGFLRFDEGHVQMAAMDLAFLTIVVWPRFVPGARAAQSVLVVSLLVGVGADGFWLDLANVPREIVYGLEKANPFSSVQSRVQADDAGAAKYFNDTLKLPRLDGTIDTYNAGQAIPILLGLHYHPRPVLQSYSAYTPKLAQMNADFAGSERAANHILFNVLSLDGRFPAQDDGCSYLNLFRCYQPRAEDCGDYVVLDHRQTPRVLIPKLVSQTTARFSELVSVPDTVDSAIWVEIDIPPTAIGMAAGLLFRDASYPFELHDSDGQMFLYRLVAPTASAGFLLSPLVKNAWTTHAAYDALDGRSTPGVPRVTEICLRDGITKPSRYSIRFYTLRYADSRASVN